MKVAARARVVLWACIVATGVAASQVGVPGRPALVSAADLTGVWSADDGGAYFLRQLGSSLWWMGLSDRGRGTSFANVFRGRVLANDVISGTWADVPRGRVLSNGSLALSFRGGEMRKMRESGGFGGVQWRRGGDVVPAAAVFGGYKPGAGDLTGVWSSDDGGVYYLRQIGDQVWWMGLSDGGQGFNFANVFWGKLSGRSFNGEWVDAPLGRLLSSGVVTLEIGPTSGIITEFRRVREKGGFGGSSWRRL
jgi:hypothetical protein